MTKFLHTGSKYVQDCLLPQRGGVENRAPKRAPRTDGFILASMNRLTLALTHTHEARNLSHNKKEDQKAAEKVDPVCSQKARLHAGYCCQNLPARAESLGQNTDPIAMKNVHRTDDIILISVI